MKSIMRYLVQTLCVALICTGTAPAAKRSERRDKHRFFIEPYASVLPVIARQPDCPLDFEEAMLLHRVGGGGMAYYRVRNRGSKPIIEFTIATIALGGSGSLVSFKAKNRREWLMPGRAYSRMKAPNVEIIPLTEELRRQHNILTSLKGILIFMVVRVEFSDSSIYNDEMVYKDLQTICENTNPASR